ncbi:MAG: hypothetical protein PHH81_10320, partial [Bacteroides graminisolvens]|nr:hypothetical protein [Bacteroides graminisolvens]
RPFSIFPVVCHISYIGIIQGNIKLIDYSRLNYTHHTLKFSFFFQKMEVFCDSCTRFRKIPLSSAEKVAKMLDEASSDGPSRRKIRSDSHL